MYYKYFLPNKLALNFHSINNEDYLYSVNIKCYIEFINELQEMNYKFLFAKDFAKYGGSEKVCTITFDDGYKDNLLVLDYMVLNQIPFTIFITSGFVENKMSSFLNVFDIKKLISSNIVEIGSHTVTHCELKSINEDDLKNELLSSKNYLSKITGTNIVSFAYPFGSYNERIIESVKKYYENSFAVYSSNKNDYVYSIPRLDINSINIKRKKVMLRDIWRYKKCLM
jgi:peptidoglycan/xylan/chitin deacetylase (PgdA/CDA1 family)